MPRVEELDPRSLAPDRTGRRRLRVLLSAFECAPGIGSESEVGWRWAVEIARLGHDVVVLTWSRDRALLEAARAAGKVPASVRFEYVMPAWLEALRARGLPLQLVHLSWQLAAYLHARKLIRRERFDLVHHITYCVIRQPSFMGRLPLPFVLGPVGGGETAPFALRRGMGARGWLLDLVRDGLNLIARLDPITRGRAPPGPPDLRVEPGHRTAGARRGFRTRSGSGSRSASTRGRSLPALAIGMRRRAASPLRRSLPGLEGHAPGARGLGEAPRARLSGAAHHRRERRRRAALAGGGAPPRARRRGRLAVLGRAPAHARGLSRPRSAAVSEPRTTRAAMSCSRRWPTVCRWSASTSAGPAAWSILSAAA